MDPTSPGAAEADNAIAYIRLPTRQLRAFIAEARAALPPADFADVTGQVQSLFDKYTAALESASPGTERGRALHRMMDQAVETAQGVAVSCRTRCCGCCHCEVEITRDEAAVLHERVTGGMAIDPARLAVQAGRERLSPEWAKFWSRENRCVFLAEEGTCRIYDDRPAACRRLFVTTPPEACTTAGAAVATVRILLAEILLSAAMSLDEGGFASISKMLQPMLAG
jgi:Fe-S-cluster containining protein